MDETACIKIFGLCMKAAGVEDGVVLENGEVIDASLSALASGVRTGMSRAAAFEMKRDMTAVKLDRTRYRAILHELCDDLARCALKVEPADEISQLFLQFPGAAKTMLDRLFSSAIARFGYGIAGASSSSKFLAKVACDRIMRHERLNTAIARSPVVLLEIPSSDEARWISSLRVDELWNVPPKIRNTLSRLGFTFARQIAEAGETAIEKAVGAWAKRVILTCRGRWDQEVKPWTYRDAWERSVQVDPGECLENAIEEAVSRFRKENEGPRRIAAIELNLFFEQMPPLTGEKRWFPPLTDDSLLEEAFMRLLQKKAHDFKRKFEEPPFPAAIKMRVLLSDAPEAFQGRFPWADQDDQRRSSWAIEGISSRYERQVIGMGPPRGPGRREMLLAAWDPLRRGLAFRFKPSPPSGFAVDSMEMWPEAGAWWEGENETICLRMFGTNGTAVEVVRSSTSTSTRRFPSSTAEAR